ncbi:MAG: hypothetical protein NW224_13675 [Leptolyngbyaceae cyanobacterium bins.302]|nr:hypothetical protein [Leptolyngbyaceae cyanobacterium bins.302]
MRLVVLVVIFNVLLGVACLWIAVRIWQFKRTLAIISDRILGAERAVHHVLYPAPQTIRKAQTGTSRLREYYARLGIQFERVQQIISILSLVQLFMRYGQIVMPRSRSSNPKPSKRA